MTTLAELDCVIFDVDGTLYEQPAVYERFAHELSLFLPMTVRDSFLTETRDAWAGLLPMRAGMGYDTRDDTLFRHADDRIVARFDWQGYPLDLAAGGEIDGGFAGPPPGAPPIEVGLFGEDDRLNLGDAWGLTDAVAAHYGLSRQQRGTAFMATRAAMDLPDFPLAPLPGLAEVIAGLRRRRVEIIAMTNSPHATSRGVLERLGLWALFDSVRTEARKPRGMRELLATLSAPDRVLAIGDNYINEIEPVLRAGGRALYIDRFDTGLGREQPRCQSVASIPAMVDWLTRLLDALDA